MNNDKKKQELFVKYLKNKYGEKNLTDEKVKELKDSGQLQKDYQDFEKALAKKAAHGTKLTYFRTLKNQCADDEELYYYKKGGSVDCGCKKKGGEVIKTEVKDQSPVNKFKAVRKGKSGFDVTALADATGSQGGFANAKPKRKTPKKGTWAEATKYIPGQTIQRGNGGPDAKEQDSAVRDRKDNPENIVKKEEKKKHSNYYTSMAFKKGDKIVKKFKAKCGSKIKKHQYGNPIYLTQFDYQNGVNLLKKGANKIWDLMNYNITNNPNIITGAPDFLPGTGGGNIGKVVGQIRKIAPGVSKAKTTLKNGKIVNSLDKKVRMAKEADLRKEAGLSYWKNLAGRLEK